MKTTGTGTGNQPKKGESIMKKLLIAVCAGACAVVLMTGCVGVTPIQGGTGAWVYTQTNAGVSVGSASGYSKVGTATSKGIICIATGDSSISAAMKNGGISKIHHVDCKVTNVLGVYSEYTTVVYGE
jgi:hypothetical protein